MIIKAHWRIKQDKKFSSFGFGSTGNLFAQSPFHIPHLSLIFTVPEPFACFLGQLRSTHQLWKFMAMFGDYRDRRTKRVSSARTFELSILLYPPAWPAHTVHSLIARLLMLYCTSAVGGQLTHNRRFNQMCGNTFCQALCHGNYRYGEELCMISAAGGNYSPHA